MKFNKLCLKLLASILFVSLAVSLLPLMVTASDPIQIKNVDDLKNIPSGADSEGCTYILLNDLTLNEAWTPIKDFRGTFDGNGHTINNLHIPADSGVEYVGLFGQTFHDVVIRNVGVNIAPEGLTASGSVASAGGLISFSNGGTVTIENCYVVGNVAAVGTAYAYAGGLIGYNSGGISIINSYTIGNIAANILGNAFATHAYAGGLLGFCYGGVFITNCYVACEVTTNSMWFSSAGGLIGRSNNIGGLSITNCYRLNTKIIGYNQDNACIQLTDEEMRTQSSFEGWDFKNVWAINPTIQTGFPYLRVLTVTLNNIEITHLPTKVQYITGDRLDLTGMVVTALYSNENTRSVTDYHTDPVAGTQMDALGKQTIKVSYTEKGVTMTTSFTVTVTIGVNDIPINIELRADDGIILKPTSQELKQLQTVFKEAGDKGVVFKLPAQSMTWEVAAAFFKDTDTTLTVTTKDGNSYTVKTKTLWNNSGKELSITVENGKLQFKNK